MSKLFIYFSLSGNGDVVAEEFKNKGFDIRKVVEKKKRTKIFFFRIMSGGFEAGINKKSKLVDYDNDVSRYDEVIIGSPIWNGRISPAINSVIKLTDLNDKKLSFVLYAGSGKAPKAIKKIAKLFPKANVIVLKEPKTYKEELEKLKEL